MKAFCKEYWFEIALTVAGLAVVALGFGGLLFGAHLGGSEFRAQIGDFVGGTTTPILTALTFIGVLVGIALQRRELIATREELKETRKETARSASALSKQASAIARQNFENSLFQSLSFLNSITENLKVTDPYHGKERKGEDVFTALVNGMERSAFNKSLGTQDDLESSTGFKNYLARYSSNYAKYLRTLYNIYRLLDESNFSSNKFYSRIVRSQISDDALIFLFYNSLDFRGLKFQKYIVRYEVLDNVPEAGFIGNWEYDLVSALPTQRYIDKFGGVDPLVGPEPTTDSPDPI